LIAAIVFCPINNNESIPNQYWLQVADFKMFISELWGKMDIAKRVVKLYTGIAI
jgi:hypothetical protein